MKRLTLTLLAGVLLFTASPALAQDDDMGDIVRPATLAECPAGGVVFVDYPICNGMPGAQGQQGPQGPAGAPGTAAPGVVQPTFIAAPPQAQSPACLSRRQFDVTIPERFRWGTRVWVLIGGRPQRDGNSPTVFVRANHRIRVALQGRPCGLYAVVVRKKGIRAWSRLYVAGPSGNVTGINLP